MTKAELRAMPEPDLLRYAASRWGQTTGWSFDAVLMEVTPRYNDDPGQTKRWHKLKDAALEMVPEEAQGQRLCPVCKHKPIVHRRAMTCGRVCGAKAAQRKLRGKKRGTTLSPAQRLEIKHMNDDGWTVAEIARQVGAAWDTVRRAMKEDGVVPVLRKNKTDVWGNRKRTRCLETGCRKPVAPPAVRCKAHR